MPIVAARHRPPEGGNASVGRTHARRSGTLTTSTVAASKPHSVSLVGFSPSSLPAAPLLAEQDQGASLCAGDFLRLWPHKHQTDGFFAAVWQRR